MSNNKLSSAEWYSREIGKITALALSGKMTGLEWKYLQAKALEKAKAMHKEEMKQTYFDGWHRNIGNRDEDFEQYYNEKFNNNEQQ